ncbi:glycosyltransferase 87 family protein [Umezawaea sp.]|uniref:glycosyltransferase 87 family protein n=1 Tax=Umezawaea sp. TaxID=1955258 RepID=UPI002ED34DDB
MLAEIESTTRSTAVPTRDVLFYGACAAFAAVVTWTGLPNHRTWAWWALCAYGLAALVPLVRGRASSAPVVLATTGAVVGPLVWMAVAGQAQNEVGVVFDAAERLLGPGSLYPTGDELATATKGVDAYFPYLPAMALLGVPAVLADRAGLGPVLSDPRATFALVYAATVLLVVRRTGRSSWLWPVLVASPLAALLLASGGDDLPVVGALLAALALSRDDRHAAAGLAVGLACAAKLTAWPVAVVLVVAVLVRRGRGPALATAGVAAAVVALFLLPVLATSADGLLVHDVRFPAGLEPIPSPAASPFPGHLLAQHVPAGRVLALVLLAAVAVALGVRLLRLPPRDEVEAARFCAAGLTAATALLPATRVGYLVYPLALLVLARAMRDTRERRGGEVGRDVAARG